MKSEKLLYFFNILVSRVINAGKAIDSVQPSEILCIKWDEIGDMATALAVFPLLKKQYPKAKITVLCKPFAGSLLDNNPHIHAVIHDVNEWQSRYDLVVELRGTWKTMWRSLHPKFWPVFRVDRGWIRFLQRGNQPHEVITNLRTIEPLLKDNHRTHGSSNGNSSTKNFTPNNLRDELGSQPLLFPSASDECDAEEWLSKARNEAISRMGDIPVGMAIIHAGARKSLRQWPLENFAEVSRWLWSERKIWSIWVCTQEEKSDIQKVYSPDLGTLWVSEEAEPKNTSLLAFYALIKRSSVFIGNESGPLQLADLAGIPLLGLFGPGVPHVFYPFNAEVLKLGDVNLQANSSNSDNDTTGEKSPMKLVIHCLLACNPCDQEHCIHPQRPCMHRISISIVLEELKNRLLTQ